MIFFLNRTAPLPRPQKVLMGFDNEGYDFKMTNTSPVLIPPLLHFQRRRRNCPSCEDSEDDLLESVTNCVNVGLKPSSDEDLFDWIEFICKHARKLADRVAKILRIGYPPDLVRVTFRGSFLGLGIIAKNTNKS